MLPKVAKNGNLFWPQSCQKWQVNIPGAGFWQMSASIAPQLAYTAIVWDYSKPAGHLVIVVCPTATSLVHRLISSHQLVGEKPMTMGWLQNLHPLHIPFHVPCFTDDQLPMLTYQDCLMDKSKKKPKHFSFFSFRTVHHY